MTFSDRRIKLLTTSSAIALLLLTSGRRAFAQREEIETALERSTTFGQRAFHATLPIAIGWFNGEPCLYISTDASDPDVAAAFKANYAPALANASSPVPIYAVTNFAQGNIVPSAPTPAGPGNKSQGYSPLWQVNMVTWNAGVTPQLLRSEQDVLAMQMAGSLTVTKTNIIVNCSIVWTQQGGALPGTTVSMTSGTSPGSTVAAATLPVVVGWFNGQHVLYISPEASNAAAGGPEANFSTLLGRSANSNAAVPIYAITNFKQGNVIPSAPLPTGPTSSASSGYSPLWQVNMVTWKTGVTPTVLKSGADVQAAQQSGNVTITKTNIIVNCPVIYTPLGGLLPGVTVTSSEN
jgi:hypothetical protein